MTGRIDRSKRLLGFLAFAFLNGFAPIPSSHLSSCAISFTWRIPCDSSAQRNVVDHNPFNCNSNSFILRCALSAAPFIAPLSMRHILAWRILCDSSAAFLRSLMTILIRYFARFARRPNIRLTCSLPWRDSCVMDFSRNHDKAGCQVEAIVIR